MADLVVHHLGCSQSERIVWLCEELDLPHALKRYERDPVTRLSPPELVRLHPLGAAPLLEDGSLVLAESGAIVEYILAKHARGRLQLAPEHPDYGHYLYWLHLANGTLQPAIFRLMTVRRAGLAADHPVHVSVQSRLDRALEHVDARLRATRHLGGSDFTVADVMSVFSLTTMRLFQPIDLQPYVGIRAYLKRIGERPAYRRAMGKCDPDLAPMLE